MAGEQFDGNGVRKFIPQTSKAFCEGMEYRQGGTLLARPIIDNPFEAGSESRLAWDAGWTQSESFIGSAITPDGALCCALAGQVVPS